MSSTPESEHLVRPADALGVSSRRIEMDLRRTAAVAAPIAPVSLVSSQRGDVAMVASVGRLEDVVTDLRRALLLALGEDPRAVVCDLSAVRDGSDADARVLVAAAGRQVRDWPAVPVAMACPDPVLRRRLRRQSMGEHVLVPATLRQAVAAMSRVAPPATAWRDLPPGATASRLARDFVSRTCLDWGMAQGIASACLVVSELVNNALRTASTDMNLALARHGGLLRLALRDRSAGLQGEPVGDLELFTGRGIALVDARSRAWGVLPGADGGKVVWAVLEI